MSSMLTAQRTTLVNRNGDDRFGYNVTTSNATPTYIDSFSFHKNEGGIFERTVIGYGKDTAHVVTGRVYVRFNVHRDALTMGTPAFSIPVVADAPLGSSTFTYVAANGKIYLRVTGQAATNITWTSITKRKTVWYLE